jgi:hypothetical protein
MATETETPLIGEPRRRAGLHAPLPQSPVVEAAPVDEDDPRSRASRRAAELREHRGDFNDGTDQFAIDPRIIPDGWAYEWKVMTVLGAKNAANEIATARGGWEPVPASRHPELMPKGWTGTCIERDGQMLMERPKEITDEANDREKLKARNQVRDKEQQIMHSPAGPNSPFATDNKGKPINNIRTTREAESLRIPD